MAFLKSTIKDLTKRPGFHRFMCGVIAGYLRFVRATTRWEIRDTEDRDRLFSKSDPFIIALWHNRIAMMPYAYPEQTHTLCVVASGHRDGQIVTGTMGRFGFDGIPVDSKDGAKATRSIIRRLKQGGRVGFTPDGPRGPRLVLKEGMVSIAAMTGVPVIPVTYSMKHFITLGTWDKFRMPLPFNRGVCRWGTAIYIPRKAPPETREHFRAQIEKVLNDMTDACDRELGQDPVPRAVPESGE